MRTTGFGGLGTFTGIFDGFPNTPVHFDSASTNSSRLAEQLPSSSWSLWVSTPVCAGRCVCPCTPWQVCAQVSSRLVLQLSGTQRGGVLSEVNRFYLRTWVSSFIGQGDGIRSWNWPDGNLCLCLPYWVGSEILVSAESLGRWAEAVLRYSSALCLSCTIWLHPWIYASAN